MAPTVPPEPHFSCTYTFHEVLDNGELVVYMTFKKILMTVCRDMDKKHQKCPKNGFFPHLWPPKIFFQKSGSITFVLL